MNCPQPVLLNHPVSTILCQPSFVSQPSSTYPYSIIFHTAVDFCSSLHLQLNFTSLLNKGHKCPSHPPSPSCSFRPIRKMKPASRSFRGRRPPAWADLKTVGITKGNCSNGGYVVPREIVQVAKQGSIDANFDLNVWQTQAYDKWCEEHRLEIDAVVEETDT